jgi:hypothetical protein
MSEKEVAMSLPTRSPSLEHLRNQARDLLKAVHAGDQQALQRVAARLPRLIAPSSAAPGPRRLRLAEALLVLAREHGFPSWPRLKAHIEALTTRPETTSATPGAGPSSRFHAARDLALEITLLARQGDATGLSERFSCLPLRDILAVRAALTDNDTYTALMDTLLAGLNHADSRIRYDSANALDHLADERCLEPLRRLVDDPVPRVRRMALHVLSCDTCKLVPLPAGDSVVTLLVERALSDPSINVRRHATAGLGSCCHDSRAIAALETLLARETDLGLLRNARWALRSQGISRGMGAAPGPVIAHQPGGPR